MTNSVTPISNEQDHNNLGLVVSEQKQRKARWVTRAPNDRVTMKRQAYETLYREHEKLVAGTAKSEIHDVLVTLSTGSIEKNFPVLRDSGNATIRQLGHDLCADTEITFLEIVRTIDDATKTKFGIVGSGKGKNSDLATIITTFSTLYDGPLENPVLPEHENETAETFLRRGALKYDPVTAKKYANSKQHLAIIEKQLGIFNYCDLIGDATDNLMRMSKSSLDMAFPSVDDGVPGDDVKNRVVRDIKIADNRFFRGVGYEQEYLNIDKELKKIKALRKENKRQHEKQERLNKRRENTKKFLNRFNIGYNFSPYSKLYDEEFEKRLSEKQLAALDARQKRDQDNEKLTYQRVKVDINRLANEDFARKQKIQRIKKSVFAIAIIFAIFVAGGQMAIALGGALAAGASAFAYIVGIASFATNYFLFQRDITSVLIDAFTGRMFDGLSTGLKISLGIYGVFSFVTGLVSAALATGSFLGVLGYASIIAAPAGPLALMVALVGIPTFIGMGALFFAVGVSIAKNIQSIADSGDPEVPLRKKLWKNFTKKMRALIYAPPLNQQALKISEQIHKLKIKQSRAQDNPALSRNLGIQIKFLEKKYLAAKRTHKARHVLKGVLMVLFIPLSIVFAVVATFALMRVSVKETYDLFLSMQKIPHAIANTIANVLTWGFAVVVNGALYTQNLMVAAKFFADKLSKFFSGIGYGIAMTGLLISKGQFFKSIRDAIKVYKDNPRKVLYPGVRAGLLIAFGVLVILNAHGNASLYRDKGTFPVPDNKFITGRMLTYLSSFLGSAVLNFMAGYAAQYSTPQKRLKRGDGQTNSYSAVTKAANDSDIDNNKAKNTAQAAVSAADATADATAQGMPANALMSTTVSGTKVTFQAQLPIFKTWQSPYSQLPTGNPSAAATNGLGGQNPAQPTIVF